MASLSYLQEDDLRRRPVRSETDNSSRIDEEVEITEVAEEQAEEQADDLDHDPLVLKGKVTAFFLHLIVLGFYVYVHAYDATVYKRNKGMGFIGSDTFGGRWKSLTYINMWLQLVYFFLAFLCDIMPMSYAKQLLAKFRDFLFTTVAFPMAIFVFIAFWSIYAIDREYIHPAEVDEFIPQLLNHLWHTTVIVPVLLEVLLVFHRYPNTLNAVAAIFNVCTCYMLWIVIILLVDDNWVYPFLEVMPLPVIFVFFVGCFLATLGIYFLGKKIAYWRWKERHLLIKELRL